MADAFGARVGVWWQQQVGSNNDTFNLDTGTGISDDDAVALVFQMPEAMTITEIGFGTAAGAGTSPLYTWSIQGLNVNGLPDGIIKGSGSPASVTEAGSVVQAFDWHTLDNPYTAARGEFLCLVVEYSSGTINGSNFVKIVGGWDIQFGGTPRMHSYWMTSTAGAAYVKNSNSASAWGVRSVSKTLGFPVKNFSGGIATYDWKNTVESGIRFKLDAGWGNTFELLGIIYAGEFVSSGGNFYMTLYDAATPPAIIETIEIDSDWTQRNASTTSQGIILFDKATLDTLSYGTEYFLALMQTGTTGRAPHVATFETANDLAALPWGGEFYSALRTVDGVPGADTVQAQFTVDNKVRPTIGLILADITKPAGGGGGQARFAMSGGMQ